MSSEIMKSAHWDDNNIPDWVNKMNWDEYEKLAAIGYTPEKIAMYYRINKLEFMYYYMLIDSKLKWHYERGILYYQAKEGIGMLDDATVSVTQAQRLDKLRSEIAFQTAKDEIIYGGL